MTALTINLGEPLFSFRSKADWINRSPDIWLAHSVTVHTAICIDTKGRIVQRGEHFARAETDKSYPITVYRMQADETAKATESAS